MESFSGAGVKLLEVAIVRVGKNRDVEDRDGRRMVGEAEKVTEGRIRFLAIMEEAESKVWCDGGTERRAHMCCQRLAPLRSTTLRHTCTHSARVLLRWRCRLGSMACASARNCSSEDKCCLSGDDRRGSPSNRSQTIHP